MHPSVLLITLYHLSRLSLVVSDGSRCPGGPVGIGLPALFAGASCQPELFPEPNPGPFSSVLANITRDFEPYVLKGVQAFGNLARLHRVADRILRGEDIGVGVVGGSLSAGNGDHREDGLPLGCGLSCLTSSAPFRCHSCKALSLKEFHKPRCQKASMQVRGPLLDMAFRGTQFHTATGNLPWWRHGLNDVPGFRSLRLHAHEPSLERRLCRLCSERSRAERRWCALLLIGLCKCFTSHEHTNAYRACSTNNMPLGT